VGFFSVNCIISIHYWLGENLLCVIDSAHEAKYCFVYPNECCLIVNMVFVYITIIIYFVLITTQYFNRRVEEIHFRGDPPATFIEAAVRKLPIRFATALWNTTCYSSLCIAHCGHDADSA